MFEIKKCRLNKDEQTTATDNTIDIKYRTVNVHELVEYRGVLTKLAELKKAQSEGRIAACTCGECKKYQTSCCSARHEQALKDFCSHAEPKAERRDGV